MQSYFSFLCHWKFFHNVIVIKVDSILKLENFGFETEIGFCVFL